MFTRQNVIGKKVIRIQKERDVRPWPQALKKVVLGSIRNLKSDSTRARR